MGIILNLTFENTTVQCFQEFIHAPKTFSCFKKCEEKQIVNIVCKQLFTAYTRCLSSGLSTATFLEPPVNPTGDPRVLGASSGWINWNSEFPWMIVGSMGVLLLLGLAVAGVCYVRQRRTQQVGFLLFLH